MNVPSSSPQPSRPEETSTELLPPERALIGILVSLKNGSPEADDIITRLSALNKAAAVSAEVFAELLTSTKAPGADSTPFMPGYRPALGPGARLIAKIYEDNPGLRSSMQVAFLNALCSAHGRDAVLGIAYHAAELHSALPGDLVFAALSRVGQGDAELKRGLKALWRVETQGSGVESGITLGGLLSESDRVMKRLLVVAELLEYAAQPDFTAGRKLSPLGAFSSELADLARQSLEAFGILSSTIGEERIIELLTSGDAPRRRTGIFALFHYPLLSVDARQKAREALNFRMQDQDDTRSIIPERILINAALELLEHQAGE